MKHLSSHYFHLKVSKHLEHGLWNNVGAEKNMPFLRTFYISENTLLIGTKGREAAASLSCSCGVSAVRLFVWPITLLCLFSSCCLKCVWTDSMKTEFFCPWTCQGAKARLLLTHLIRHAKLVRNFNNFGKYWKETRKLNLNLHIIHAQ